MAVQLNNFQEENNVRASRSQVNCCKRSAMRPHTSLGFRSNCINDKGVGLLEPHHSFGSPEPPWRSSSKYIDPGYGYEKNWRSSRARVEGGGDSHFGIDAAPAASEEQNQWKSSIRYINPGSGSWSEAEWRSSVKTVKPQCNDTYPEWRPRVRVFKLSDCRTEWRMSGGRRHVPAIKHSEPLWRSCRAPGNPPPLKWVPPFRNLKLPSPKTKALRKRVSGYFRRHPQLQMFSARLVDDKISITGNSLMPHAKEIRAKVAAYFKLHPPLHLFSSPLKTASGIHSKEYFDGSHPVAPQDIPKGHEDDIENPGCMPKESTVLPVKTLKMWSALGPQHDPASYRNVITGKIGPLDDWKPPKVTLGPGLLAPAGNFHKDVIDNRFAGPQNTLEPEIPSYLSQLFSKAHASAHEEYKRNLLHATSADHFKGYLYEVKDPHTNNYSKNL